MPLQIICQDITKILCDAIVNPTDEWFSGGGGTDRAIHAAAGEKLALECRTLEPLAPGRTAVTGAYDLPCRYIIHTVGPVWTGGGNNEEVLLRSCYINALLEAQKRQMQSVAFPLISAGTFGFPRDKVMAVALKAIGDYLGLLETEPEIYLCVYDRLSYDLANQCALDRYIALGGDNFPVDCEVQASMPCPPPAVSAAPSNKKRLFPGRRQNKRAEEEFLSAEECAALPLAAASALPPSLEDWIRRHDDSFAVTLMKLIDKKGMTDVQCYKKANVSKGTFWKINNEAGYRPSKQTVLAFAIALELSLEETEQLLRTVGFSLSHSSTFDLIIEFYISNGCYDIYEINAALYQYDQVCLGC